MDATWLPLILNWCDLLVGTLYVIPVRFGEPDEPVLASIYTQSFSGGGVVDDTPWENTKVSKSYIVYVFIIIAALIVIAGSLVPGTGISEPPSGFVIDLPVSPNISPMNWTPWAPYFPISNTLWAVLFPSPWNFIGAEVVDPEAVVSK